MPKNILPTFLASALIGIFSSPVKAETYAFTVTLDYGCYSSGCSAHVQENSSGDRYIIYYKGSIDIDNGDPVLIDINDDGHFQYITNPSNGKTSAITRKS